MRLPKIDCVLATDNELKPILTKAREIRALAGLVDGFLPPDLARQVRVANFKDGELVLLAGHSAAAAKIRLLAPTLGRYLAAQRRQVNSVSVRVQPNASRAAAPGAAAAAARKPAPLSAPALEALRALYRGMRASPARDALRALIERGDAPKAPPAGAPQGTAAAPAEPRRRRT